MKTTKTILMLVFLICLVPSVLSSSNSSNINEWTMFGRNLNHGGYYLSKIELSSLRNVWNFTVNDTFSTSPLVFDGKVYVGNWNGYLYALDLNNGSLIWDFGTLGISITPAISEGKIYFGDYNETFYCLNASNGNLIWNATPDTGGAYDFYTSPVVLNGVVYFGSLAVTSFYALNATDGTEIWDFPLGQNHEAPAIVGDVVYFDSYLNSAYRVIALNITTGNHIWNYSVTDTIVSSPAIKGGIVYVGSNDNKMYALNSTTGSQIWNYNTGGDVRSSPAVYDGKVYFGSSDGKVYAVSASTGSLIWNYTVGDIVWSSPVVTKNGIVFIGADDDKVYGFNASTGNKLWEFLTGGDLAYLSPIIVNENLIISSDKLYVFSYLTNSTNPIITNVLDYPDPLYVHDSDIGIIGFAINGTISQGDNPLDRIFLSIYNGGLVFKREWGLLPNQTNGTWQDIILYNETWGYGTFKYNITANDTEGLSSTAFGNITFIYVSSVSPDHGYGIYGLLSEVGAGSYFLISLISNPLFYLFILLILVAIFSLIGMSIAVLIKKYK